MRQITVAILTGALLTMLLTAWAFPRINEDLFLGLCLGREVSLGTFTDPNSWSFVLPAQGFVDRAWLSHFLYYVSYTVLGSFGPLSIKAILLACCAAILFYRCRALDISREISLLAATFGMFALAPFLTIRGENFGILCFLALTTFLTASPRWGRYRQLGAVLVVVLWSNCHGTWPLGALLIGIRFGLDLLYALDILRSPYKTEALSGTEEGRAEPQGISHHLVARNALQPRIETGPISPSRVHCRQETGPDSAGLAGRVRKEGRGDRHRWLKFSPQQYDAPDPVGWLLAGLALIPVLILVNPYGLRSFLVFDYVWGMDEFERVVQWRDNLPLINLRELLGRPFYNAISVLPFLTVLILLALLTLTMFLFRKRSVAATPLLPNPIVGDKWMEIATLIILIPMVFKWRRLVTFCAPGLVPVLGLLIQANLDLLGERFLLSGSRGGSAFRKWAPVVAAAGIFAAVGILFYTSIVRSYLPNNPMGFLRVAPPLQERMMSYDQAWNDVVEFMRRNHISGRIMASLQLADYMLFNLPDVRIFMDLRAQAGYTPANFTDYFAVVRTRSGSVNRAENVLDRFQVDFVVLESIVENHVPAALALMETRKWACIYKDRWVYVLVRTDSHLYRSMPSTGKLNGLWYKNPETRYVSEAFLSQFMTGSISDELLGRVKEAAREFPDPEVYVLMALAMKRSDGCLPEQAKTYFREEALRLSRSNYMISGGVRDILESARRLCLLLYEDATECGPKALAPEYREYAEHMAALFKELCRKYSVIVTCR